MNESDQKAIEELLSKQTESFNKQIDARFGEQEKRLVLRFQEQEKRLDLRFQEQEKRLEKRMIQVFNEGFDKVVLPHLSELNDKFDDLYSRTGRIERKLDAVVERQDRQGQEIESVKKFIHMPEGA